MNIRPYLDELEKVQHIIKKNNIENRQMHKREKVLMKHVQDFLVSSGQKGLKYNNKIILLQTNEHRPPKSKKEKEQDMIDVLQTVGIPNAVELYKKLMDSQRRSPQKTCKIKIEKNIKR